jgi:flagellar biogenesis protein FliO
MIFNAKILIFNGQSKLVAAADASQEALFQSQNNLPSGDYGAAFVKMFLTLIVLILLLCLTTWVLKRLLRARWEKRSSNQMIHILEKRMLSPKTMLYFIEVDGKKMVIAESQLEVKELFKHSPLGGIPYVNDPSHIDITR